MAKCPICRKFLTVGIVLSLILAGCSGEPEHPVRGSMEIDVEGLAEKPVSIYDLFSKVEIVALDGSVPISNSVYTGASNIAFDGDNFYILDMKTLGLCVFDGNGGLVCHADKRGRGPGEYTMADQVMYNPILDMVEILDPRGRIYRYSTDSLKFMSVLDYTDECLATHNYFTDGERYILYSFSSEDKFWDLDTGKSEIVSYGYRPPEYLVRLVSPQSPFFEIDGKPAVFRIFDGLVYVFDDVSHRLVPYIGWDFCKYQGRLEDIPEYDSAREYHEFILDYSGRKLCPFIDMKGCGEKIFASVIFDCGKTWTLYHDMESGESCLFWKTVDGMLFLPELFHDGIMYKYTDAHNLPDYVSREILDDSSRKAYDKVLSECGSAIIKYYLK